MPSSKSVRVNKITPVNKSAPVHKSTPVKKSPRFSTTFGAVVIFLVGIGVLTVAMVIGAREPSPSDIPTVKPQTTATRASASKTSSTDVVPAAGLAADMTPANASAASAASAPASKPATVTITGCLERHDETFRLKDATGVDAPKSRSWRSGFLKKGSASIDVVDAANKLKLTDHVGQRISVTGVLVDRDREMQVRSLRRVAASCS